MGVLPLRRRRRVEFERASDGSMTLMEHLRELRSRLFKGSLAVLAGMGVGFWLAGRVLKLLQTPYCDYVQHAAATANHGAVPAGWRCTMLQLGVADLLVLNLKIAMWVGLIVAAPIWMYQLWAFVAPGLHRHERRWAYAFASVAAPLFALGAVLAYYVVAKGLQFLLQFAGSDVSTQLEITRYVSFITGLMLLFGVAFEFPLAILLMNVAGVLSARKMLGWWRIAVFLFFAFSAVATPTADPFGMTALGLALSALYFAAVGVAFLNDRRRRRKQRNEFGDLADDDLSPLEYDSATVGELDPVDGPEPVSASAGLPAPEPVGRPRAIDARFDDVT